MTNLNSPVEQSADACASDRGCVEAGCGCAAPTTSASVPVAARRGLAAGLLAAACAVDCLAGPLALGGVAAASGAVAGQWWLLIGVTVAAIVIGAAMLQRRRTGNVC